MELRNVMIALMAGIIAFAFLPAVVTPAAESRTLNSVTTEWWNGTSNTSLVTVSNSPVQDNSETIVAYNLTGSLLGTLVEGTNYTVTSYDNGQFQMVSYGAVPTANLSFDYNWHSASYIDDDPTRGMVTVVLLMLLLGGAVAAMYPQPARLRQASLHSVPPDRVLQPRWQLYPCRCEDRINLRYHP